MNWNKLLSVLGSVALVLGLAAAAADGALHRALFLATFLVGVAVVVLTVHGFPAGKGAGDPRLEVVHRIATLGYIVMLIFVVFLVLVRTGLFVGGIRTAALRLAPAAVGAYIALLCFILVTRNGIRRDALTVLTGRAFMVGSVPILMLGAVLLPTGGTVLSGVRFSEIDFFIAVFLGVIAASTQVLLVAELPTVFQQIRVGVARAQDADATVSSWPPVAVAVTWAAMAMAAAAVAVPWTGIGFFAAVIGTGLLAFGLSAWYAIHQEGARGHVVERMSARSRNQFILYGTTGITGALLLLLYLGVITGHIAAIGPFRADAVLAKDLLVAAIIVTAGPIGWYLHREARRLDAIEMRLPDFLNDLAENRRAGLTLPAAMQAASQADYGALTVEVRRMAKQVAWGVSFNEAMSLFAKRIRSALVRRTVYLIIEAGRTGGSVADILRAAGADAYEIKSLESERRVTMLTYLIVIYVVFVVFLAVIGILDARFVPEVLAANQAAVDAGPTGRQLISITQEELQFVYFNAGIIQSVGNGLLGGVLAYGQVRSGLRHVAFMTFMTWALFRFLLPT